MNAGHHTPQMLAIYGRICYKSGHHTLQVLVIYERICYKN